jgi:superfamily II DNA or RNA helicase
VSEQLPLDFSLSSAERQRRARRRVERAEEKPLGLFAAPPNFDVHLHSPQEAVASIAGPEPDAAALYLQSLVGPLRSIKSRRYAFPTAALDRLLWLRPPAQVTLDAAAGAVARALWAARLGLKPLVVSRQGRRLLASSPRWPSGLRVVDAPWTTIATLTRLGVRFDVEENAYGLLMERLADAGAPLATAGLAGSSVLIETSRPDLLLGLELPALAYAGDPSSGRFQLPLLAAERLLGIPQISRTAELDAAIKEVSRRPRPLETPEGFPWTLYGFQAFDAGRAARILEITGGVLLAGEMGSGKTTVSLALVETMDLWPLLVVSPLSAFSTWSRQLEQMGRTHYLATDNPAEAWKRIDDPALDAVVISYDRLHAFAELVEHRSFRCIIADEVQRIRSANSRRSRSLRALASSVPYRMGLSGTPLTNTIGDLLPVGAFLIPGEWRPRANVKDLTDTYPGDPVEAIAEHLGSMMVRRRMVDTGAKLPRRNDHRVYVQLTAEQRRALDDLEEEARRAKEDGEFADNSSKMHAFTRLQKMRQIINAPAAAGVGGPNPKVVAALELVEDFLAMGRKGVLFCADRATFRDLGERLTASGIGWVGIWGSTPPHDRILAEKRFHEDPDVKVVLCTIQAGSESWSASPTATWLISVSYMYAPATLAQMEARVYRMNSDPDGPEIEILYVHAQGPEGSLDDRMVEILEQKKHLFAQVVDRTEHVDPTKVHYSLGDLVFLLTGERDESIDARIEQEKKDRAAEKAKKERIKYSLKKFKTGSSGSSDYVRDDGSSTITREEFDRRERTGRLDDDDLFAAPDSGEPASGEAGDTDDAVWDTQDGDDV